MTQSNRLAFGLLPLALSLALGGCHQAAEQLPGNQEDHRPFDGIAAADTLHFTGTEPFWGGEFHDGTLTWHTPENTADGADGERVAATRFAGRGGASVSATIKAGQLTLAATPAECSDGMSDRVYPFRVTVELNGELLEGCGWTDRQPFKGTAQP